MQHPNGYVTTQTQDGVATIRFFHPAHNSLPTTLLHQLTEHIEAAANDANALILVIESVGERTFCAGASFDELASIQDFETGKRFFSGFAGVCNALRKCPKLTIGRVQGKAIGGGVGIASATDYCMATQFASVKLSELAVGIGPFVIGPFVARKMGVAAFSELAINATEWRTAEWAKTRGLFQEVFETTEQLDAYIVHLSQKLVASNPDAMRELKAALWHNTEHFDALIESRAAVSGRLVLSDFTKRFIADFKA
jgi:methylglutaconyl-CoA hydratase